MWGCRGVAGRDKIQFQIPGFRSVWKLNVNKVLFHCAMIYDGAGQPGPASLRIERNDSPHILEKKTQQQSARKNGARQMDDLQASLPRVEVKEFV